MPVRTSVPTGAPAWVDLMTSDPERTRPFYCELLGWTAAEPSEEFGGYFMFNLDGEPVAGCMQATADSGMRDAWSIYLATDDVDKTLAAASAEGATVVVPAMPVGDSGTMGHLIDPTGAGIGVWQAKDFIGFATYAEVGAPSWWELHTRDYDTALSFYRNVFGWHTEVISDSAEFRYTVQMVDGGQAAGVMDAGAFLPEGVPSHWSVYFAVADADAAVARVAELGGSVVTPPEDSPYGRLATVADPTGAQFKLVAPNAAMPAR